MVGAAAEAGIGVGAGVGAAAEAGVWVGTEVGGCGGIAVAVEMGTDPVVESGPRLGGLRSSGAGFFFLTRPNAGCAVGGCWEVGSGRWSDGGTSRDSGSGTGWASESSSDAVWDCGSGSGDSVGIGCDFGSS